jgi:hypothetical protein
MAEVPPPADPVPFPREYVGGGVALTLTPDQLYVEFAESLQATEIEERLAQSGLHPVQEVSGTTLGPDRTGTLDRRRWLRSAEGEDVAHLIADLRGDDRVRFAAPVFHRADLLPARTGFSCSDQLLVRFAPEATDEQVAALLAAHEAEVVASAPHPREGSLHQVRLRAPQRQDVFTAATELARSPLVRYAAPDWIQLHSAVSATPGDSLFGQQWNLSRIGAPAAWDISRGGTDVVIAIVDSGCDLDHPDLQDKYVPVADRRDVLMSTNTPEDPNGHGTACAGVAAAETDNGQGVAGVGWNCSVMPVRILDATGRFAPFMGIVSEMVIVAAIDWARTHGADVVSMSWHWDGPHANSDIALDDAHAAGLVLIAASGNCNPEGDCAMPAMVNFPASHGAVMAVGATDEADRRKEKSDTETRPWQSQYGDQLDVMAPGVIPWTTGAGGGYSGFSGTSAATPHVAGLAGLLLALLRDPIDVPAGVGRNDLVRNVIERTAAKVGGYAYAADGVHLNGTWHREMGYGRIDAAAALRFARDNHTNYKLARPSHAYAVSVRILLGLLGGGAGIVLPTGGLPVPVDPAWALLPAEKRDVLLGLVVTELAEGVSDPQARRSLRLAGREAIERAARQIGHD